MLWWWERCEPHMYLCAYKDNWKDHMITWRHILQLQIQVIHIDIKRYSYFNYRWFNIVLNCIDIQNYTSDSILTRYFARGVSVNVYKLWHDDIIPRVRQWPGKHIKPPRRYLGSSCFKGSWVVWMSFHGVKVAHLLIKSTAHFL